MDKRLIQRQRALLGNVATATSGTTGVDSAAIDRLGANGAMARSALLIYTASGATQTGGTAPTAATITPTVKDGPSSSPATAVTMLSALPAVDCLANTCIMFNINLEGLNRYFKVVNTPAVSAGGGGSAGTITFSLAVVLGDMDIVPEATVPTVYEKA